MKQSDLRHIANSIQNDISKDQIAVLASQLPTSYKEIQRQVKGRELIKSGMKEHEGPDGKMRPVLPNGNYSDTVLIPLDHNREMLKRWKKSRSTGVKNYLIWFEHHHMALMQKYPQFIVVKKSNSIITKI